MASYRGQRAVRFFALVLLGASKCFLRSSAFRPGGVRRVPICRQHRGSCKMTETHMWEGAEQDEPVDRGTFAQASALMLAVGGIIAASPQPSQAIGELPEFRNQSRFAQHVTVQVPNMEDALRFWIDGVGMSVQRTNAGKRFNATVVGFGPEALKQPPDFVPGVSSFAGYGGHFSLEFVSQRAEGGLDEEMMFYDTGSGVQFLQVAVEEYRISKIAKYGGIIESGYGFIQALTPGGLRIRLLSGVRRDPPMFLAIKVSNMKRSIKWYTDVMGMNAMSYPLARAPGSPFEPPQPKNSVFMAYEGEAFGVLLVPAERDESVKPGSFISLAVLTEDLDRVAENYGIPIVTGLGEKEGTRFAPISDPDGYTVNFVDYGDWEKQLPRLA